MTKNHKDEQMTSNEFAALLDNYSPAHDSQVRVGDKIRGKIISISDDAVFVETGTKIDGFVEKTELLDENKQLPYKEGDSLELYVVSLREDEIRLSQALSGTGSFTLLKEAHDKAVPVEGTVLETCKGGLRVEVMGRRAFCPASQIDNHFVERLQDYVGDRYQFLITRLDARDKNIVISRKALLRREFEKSKKQFYAGLQVEQVINGQVTQLMPYGVFVELHPGVEGLVHISELSWSRINAPEMAVSVGQAVQVKVIGLETQPASQDVKISLSIKQVTDDPWKHIDRRFKVGDKVNGKVTRCAKFGAFVEIAHGIEGLVHISEMSYQKRILKPEEIVTPGESVYVLVKELDLENKRISLSIRDAEGDPWREVPQKFKKGQTIFGIIENKEKFGYFISLAPGITGLLPQSKISRSHQAGVIEKLKAGSSIPVVIEEISVNQRKITLSPGTSEDEQDWQTFVEHPHKSMSSLGEKLQKALASKKKPKT